MASSGRKRHLDFGSALGLLLAAGGILGGFMLEGGKPFEQMMGLSAALIVFGGCLGATMVANPLRLVIEAFRQTADVLFEEDSSEEALIDQLVTYAIQARKEGVVSLESEAQAIEDPYFRKTMMLAVDGTDLQELRNMMELESDVLERTRNRAAHVYEAAGGFAPTIGIIGAVLGLIIVMGHIDDMSKVGHGIAAAFVATIYGVGSANILFLPAAHKIKMRAKVERDRQEMILEGVTGIIEGLNPKLVRMKLESHSQVKDSPSAGASKPAKAQVA